MPGLVETLGFVASESSKCDELNIVSTASARSSATFMISSRHAADEARRIQRTDPATAVVIDTREWHSNVASADAPTLCHDGLGLEPLEQWAKNALAWSRATAVLTPSYFVPLGDWAALRAVIDATTETVTPGLIPHIATPADHLGLIHRAEFFGELERADNHTLAFTFTRKSNPLGHRDRLAGLHELLRRRPGSWILGVEIPVGIDAMVRGAGWVAVGASSGRRLPDGPGDGGSGGNSKDFLPGLFLRELFATRSPSVYADWFANRRSPFCETCGRALDLFESTATDKAAIVRHNVHAVGDLVLDIQAQSPSSRASWLYEEFVRALLRHADLTTGGTPPEADRALRVLCELDDPFGRRTSATGWR